MSIKLIHFRDDNQGVSFFEGCCFDINTRAKEFSFNPDGEESSFSAGFHEIFIKQKNIICIFDFETKVCRLAAIYLDQSECDGDFDFIKRKVNPKIEENHAKNLYKNNFVLSLVGILVDQPLSFVPGLKNVIVEILGLALPTPVVAASELSKPIHTTMVENSTNANNNETLPTTETPSPSPSPIINLPRLSPENDSPTSSGSSLREEFVFAAPIGIPRRNGQGSGSSRSRSIVNGSSHLSAVNPSPAASEYGPSLISNSNLDVDDIISDFAIRRPRTPTTPVARNGRSRTTVVNNAINKAPAETVNLSKVNESPANGPSSISPNNLDNAAYIVSNYLSRQTQIEATVKRANRSRTTVVNNNNINKSLATQRKRMRSIDRDFGSNDLESSVAENAPKKKKSCIQPNAAAPQSNDKIIHLPNYFFRNVLTQNGKKTSKHLFTMAPNSNSLAYEYESRSESKGEYRCIKCFKNDNKTVSAKFNFQHKECTLGRNNHQCEAQICVRQSTDTSH